MRKTLLISSALALTLLLTLGATGAPRPGGHDGPPHGGGPLGRLIMAVKGRMMTLRAELNLTDQQRDAIRETIQAHKQELAAAIKPAVEARRTLRDAVLAEKADDAAIRAAGEDLGKKVGDAAVVVAKVKAQVLSKANFTPEQRKKIDDFRAANDASVDDLFEKLVEK